MAKEVDIRVRGIRRKDPDLRKLARVLIQLALVDDDQSNKAEATSKPPRKAAV